MGNTESLLHLHPETSPVEEFSLPEEFHRYLPQKRVGSFSSEGPQLLECEEEECVAIERHIDNLPSEILTQIFSYLTVPQICQSVLPVCKKWREIGYSKSLWKCLKFGYGWAATRCFHAMTIKRLIRRAPLLRVFEYHCPNSINNIIVEVAKRCPKLQILELQCQSLSYKTVEKLVLGCPFICQISFHKVEGTDSTNFLPLANLKHLKALELSRCDWADACLIEAMAKSCTQLQYLNLHHLPNLSNGSLAELLSSCKGTLKILMLCLESFIVTEAIFASIAQCEHLQRLTVLPAVNATDKSFLLLQNLSRLVSVTLSRLWKVTPTGCKKLFSHVNWKTLREVDFVLSDCINDESICCLVKNACNLEILSMERCSVTDAGMAHVVFYSKRLVYLNLEKMNGLRGTFLPDIEAYLPHLLVLRVDHCDGVNDHFLQKFVSERRKSKLNVFTEKSDAYATMENSLMKYPATHQARFQVKFCDLQVRKNIPFELSSLVFRRSIW